MSSSLTLKFPHSLHSLLMLAVAECARHSRRLRNRVGETRDREQFSQI